MKEQMIYVAVSKNGRRLTIDGDFDLFTQFLTSIQGKPENVSQATSGVQDVTAELAKTAISAKTQLKGEQDENHE